MNKNILLLKTKGFFSYKINRSLQNNINTLLTEIDDFFKMDKNKKLALFDSKIISGYRALGAEYSDNSNLLDLKESFSFRSIDYDFLQKIDNQKLLKLLKNIQEEFDYIAQTILKELRKDFNVEEDISTANNSWLQINNYIYSSNHDDREFLLEEHDDENIITLTISTNNGLEIKNNQNNKYTVQNENNKLLIFSGGILSLLTGGEIKPSLHRVRNIKNMQSRISIMYFVHQDKRINFKPWIKNEYNHLKDIASISLKSPLNHGLPAL